MKKTEALVVILDKTKCTKKPKIMSSPEVRDTFCDIQKLSVTDTDCLWQTLTVCDGQTLSLIDTDRKEKFN